MTYVSFLYMERDYRSPPSPDSVQNPNQSINTTSDSVGEELSRSSAPTQFDDTSSMSSLVHLRKYLLTPMDRKDESNQLPTTSDIQKKTE